MKRFQKALLITSICFILTFSSIQIGLASAAEIPDWAPDEEELEGYSLLWENSTEFENYFDPEAENMTAYGQFWYKNGSQNELVSIVALQMMEFAQKVWDEEIDTDNQYMNIAFPDFEGDNIWDLLVYVFNMTGEVEDITADMGWDHAVIMNYSGGYFQHLIFGTIDTKLVVSYALSLENSWFTWTQEYLADYYNLIGFAFTNMISNFISAIQALQDAGNLFFTSEMSAPMSAAETTDVEELKTFTKSAGDTIKADLGGGIDGAPMIWMGILSTLTIAAVIFRKRKH